MDWLVEYMEDPEKRVRLFKICVLISQGMVVLGALIAIWIFRDSLEALMDELVKFSITAFTTRDSVSVYS